MRRNFMIFLKWVFVIVSRSSLAKPFIFSRKIFCPAGVPGLKSSVNGFSTHETDMIAWHRLVDLLLTGCWGNGYMAGALWLEQRLCDIQICWFENDSRQILLMCEKAGVKRVLNWMNVKLSKACWIEWIRFRSDDSLSSVLIWAAVSDQSWSEWMIQLCWFRIWNWKTNDDK